MPRRPVRDWLTTEEAADFLGISISYMRTFLNSPSLPHSEMIPQGWLHYKGDLEKLKAEREKNPPRPGRPKRIRPPSKNPRRRKAESANAESNGPDVGIFPAKNTLPTAGQTPAPEAQERKEG